MRSPVIPHRAETLVPPVQPRPETPARERQARERSFAELLAEAEAVQDLIDVRRRATGLRGAWQSAAGFVARRTPWLGLPLLQRDPAGSPRRRASR